MKILVIILLLLSASLAYAGPVTLYQAGSDMLEHAPSLQSAEADRNSMIETENLGQAALLPYLAASGSWMKQRQITDFDKPISFPIVTDLNMNVSTMSLRAMQPLFDLERWGMFRQGEASAAMGEASFRFVKGQSLLMTAMAWLDVMRAHARFSSAKAGEEAMARVAEQAAASFEVGLEPVNASLVAVSRRDLARAERIVAEQGLDQARTVLSSLLGYEADVEMMPTERIRPEALPPGDEKEWLERSEQAARVEMARQGVELADASYVQTVGTALPKVQLVAGYDRQQSSNGTFGSGSTVKGSFVGIDVNIPLYAGGSLWAQRRKSLQEQVKADADLAEAKRSARLEIRKSWLGWRGSASRLTAMKAAMASASTERKAAAAGFEVGLRNITEVLDAEERLATARAGFTDAVAAHAMAMLRFYDAAGTLDLDRFDTVQQWLESGER